MTSKPILGYWSIRAYAQPIRHMLAFLEVEFEDKLYTFDNKKEWLDDKFNLELDFPNLPYWIDGDFRLTESKAILKHVARVQGKSKNLLPTDSLSASNLDMLENVVSELWELLFSVCYKNTSTELEALKTVGPVKFDLVSKYLGNKKFLLSDQITYVDFILYEVLHFYNSYDASFLKSFTNLAGYTERFEAIPAIAAYIKSPNYMSKGCTSPDATFPI